MAQDPFYARKAEVEHLTASMTSDFDSWNDLLQENSLAPQFNSLTQKLHASKRTNTDHVTALNAMISAIEKNRSRFASIDDRELFDRKQFTLDTAASTARIRTALTSSATKAKIERDERLALEGSSPERKGKGASTFLASKESDMMQLEDDQNAIIGDMSEVLDRLTGIARAQGEELSLQATELEVMDGGMSEVQNQFDVAFTKFEKLFPNQGSKRCCIVILAIIVVIEMFLIVYV
jgi:hypothetical protein